MCRFLAYAGPQILMADLLTRSHQSLIRQSYKAREREEPLNGDGFGVGWYVPEIDLTPCVFTSVQPAWANRNLRRLADKIRSKCVLAHVRAASPGTPVSELNCHPFQYDRFLWMHNGKIAGFKQIRRSLLDHLNDNAYDAVQGTTDSEHVFGLFLNELGDKIEDYSLPLLCKALRKTIERIEHLQKRAHISDTSFFNFCLTDGSNVLATRYVTNTDVKPQSLYIARGQRFELRSDGYRMIANDDRVEAAIIASEPLTDDRDDWQAVPVNHLVTVSPDFLIDIQPL